MMVGHIAVPQLDEGHPARPASLSPMLVHEFLRNRWDFKGVVLSDDIAMAGAATDGNVEKAAVQALEAGCDALILADPSRERIRSVCVAIEDAVNAGVLTAESLSESKRRLDGLQTWLQDPHGLPGDVPELPEDLATPAQAKAEPTEPAAERPTEEEAPEKDAASEETVAAAEPDASPGAPEEPSETSEPEDETAEAAPEPSKPAEEEAPKPAPAPAKPTRHEVKPGDTLTRIASRYGVSIEDLKAWNNLEGDKILLGQKLKVSPPG
jgi:beta-glucosidase-like glycosyl hydrolase